MKNFITALIGFTLIHPTIGLTCKSPDYSYWLSLTDKELRQHGCVRDQLFMPLYSHNNKTENVVKLGKKLRLKGVFATDSLKLEADALYKTKKYDEALKVYLLSQSATNNCEAKSTCGKDELSDATEHYELYKYYQGAKRQETADTELKKGNIELEKACKFTNQDKNNCQELQKRMLEMIVN